MRRRELLRLSLGTGSALVTGPGLASGSARGAGVDRAAQAVDLALAAPRGASAAGWPAPLAPGSRIAALAPGTWLEPGDDGLAVLRLRCEEQGWTLQTPRELFGRWRWFSGSDAVRADALRRAWADSAVQALFYVGAGWGSTRLLEQGFQVPPGPRWTVGFSDCSALLLAQRAAGSLGAIHGWFGGDMPQWRRLAGLLRGEAVAPLQGRGHGTRLQGGHSHAAAVAEGPLMVSNLTIATSLIGTPWLPSLQGCVLVLEDTGEAPYRIDRLLTQWRSSGLLRGVRGIGLGRFDWARDDILPGDFSMEEILLERLALLGVPLVSGLAVGHGRPNLALPLGRRCRLDATAGTLTLLD
ncbi:S66 peptidase family protein [Vulcanococcus limneticus]|uniref:S66 peptidase family protein n=1 Tax=Vulcanococcus limneticus TaxID=2170428 RepID=UPI00398C1216